MVAWWQHPVLAGGATPFERTAIATARGACIDACLGLQHTEITTGTRYIMQKVL